MNWRRFAVLWIFSCDIWWSELLLNRTYCYRVDWFIIIGGGVSAATDSMFFSSLTEEAKLELLKFQVEKQIEKQIKIKGYDNQAEAELRKLWRGLGG